MARSRYPVPGRRINEGPGTFLEEPRAFYTLARIRARSPCLYAIAARLCPVLRAGMMGASEKSYRLYSCGRCAEQVRICSDCDRGNQYCASECARIRRRESRHRAGKRYQLSYRGALRHAARQLAWRSRQAPKVTHQGSLAGADLVIVAAISTQSTTEATHVDMASMQPPVPPHRMPHAVLSARPMRAHGRWHAQCMARSQRCSFCWRALPPFARLGTLHGGP